MIDHSGRGQAEKGAAQAFGDVFAPLRQPFDMRLVHDRVGPRNGRAPLAAPGERLVDHHPFRYAAAIVAPVERQVRPRTADAVAEIRVGPSQPAHQPLGVRVEQQLVVIETKTFLGRIGTVHPVTVNLARPDVGNIAVPNVVAALRQNNAFEFAAALLVEQAQLDLLRMGREQREIGAAPVPGGAQRVRRAGGNSPLAIRERKRLPRAVG
jgi:hypothetical protein